MNIEKGKYWDEACNPIVTDRCTCEVVNCWAKDMLRRFPTLNPSPDENGVGWYPDRLNKISVTGAAKVYAMCWLGDIGWDIYNISLDVQILEMFDIISGIEDGRIMHGLQPHSHLFLTGGESSPNCVIGLAFVLERSVNEDATTGIAPATKSVAEKGGFNV
jgi:hypothetical protein